MRGGEAVVVVSHGLGEGAEGENPFGGVEEAEDGEDVCEWVHTLAFSHATRLAMVQERAAP